jgi:hypothetical protein
MTATTTRCGPGLILAELIAEGAGLLELGAPRCHGISGVACAYSAQMRGASKNMRFKNTAQQPLYA